MSNTPSAFLITDENVDTVAVISTPVSFAELFYDFGKDRFSTDDGDGFVVNEPFVLKAFNYRLFVKKGWKVLKFDK